VLRGNDAGYFRGEVVQCVELQPDFDRMDARWRDQAAFLRGCSIFSVFAAYFLVGQQKIGLILN
jgi:hypothetical protein